MKLRKIVVAGLVAVPGLAFAQGGMGGQQQPMGQQQQMGGEHAQVFQNKKESFELRGTVTQAEGDKLTLTRKNLPEAELMIDPQTEIKIDGRQARIEDIQPGSEVRARFQLANDQPIAVEIDAKRPKGQPKQPGQTQ